MGLFDMFGGSSKPKKKAGGAAARDVRAAANLAREQTPYIYDTTMGSIIGQMPRYGQALLDTYKQVGPEFARLGSEIDAANQAGSARADLDVLRTTGRDITLESAAQDRSVDPEYYNTRSLLAGKAADLLGGQDPNVLTGSELANVERGLARTNPGGNTSNTGTIENALTFGNELTKKRALLNDTLGQVGSLLGGFRSGTFNYAAASGKSGLANTTAQSQFDKVSSVGDNAFGISSNLLGQAGTTQLQKRQIDSEKIAGWEKVVGALPDYS